MKSYTRNLSVILVSLVIFSCKEKNETNAPQENTGAQCFAYRDGRDTINLRFTESKSGIKGSLEYTLQEKDRNTGTIDGQREGDLIIAYYEFKSEGVTSVRQVVFKKINENWVEGFGEVEIVGDTTKFKNPKHLSFIDSIQLSRVNCE